MRLTVQLLTRKVSSTGGVMEASGSWRVLEKKVLVLTYVFCSRLLPFLCRIFSIQVFIQEGCFLLIFRDICCAKRNKKENRFIRTTVAPCPVLFIVVSSLGMEVTQIYKYTQIHMLSTGKRQVFPIKNCINFSFNFILHWHCFQFGHPFPFSYHLKPLFFTA